MNADESQEWFEAPNLPGMRHLEFAMVRRRTNSPPAEFCDALSLGPGRVVLVQGMDFTGGAEGARLVADLRAHAHDCLRDLGDQPVQCLNELNRRLIRRPGTQGACCVTFGFLDDATLRLEFVGGGDGCVIVHPDGSGEGLEGGLPLSLVESPAYSSQSRHLARHDILVHLGMAAATVDGSPLLGDSELSALATAGGVAQGSFVAELNRQVRAQAAGPDTYWQVAMLARAI